MLQHFLYHTPTAVLWRAQVCSLEDLAVPRTHTVPFSCHLCVYGHNAAASGPFLNDSSPNSQANTIETGIGLWNAMMELRLLPPKSPPLGSSS